MEPASKKLKPQQDGPYVEAQEWIMQHPHPINVHVIVANHPDRPDLNMKGQTLLMTSLLVSASVTVLKERIQKQTGLAPAKQKLTSPPTPLVPKGTVMKDALLLANYNLGDGDTIMLNLKERGGRK
jgi:splicing factor 3A subunit 1